MNPRLESVTPRLPVHDVEAALTFYCRQLGFRVEWRWGNPVSHAQVCRDAIAVDLIASPAGRHGPAMAYIHVSGVDAYFTELKLRNVALGQLGERPYGMRDFELVDPWGNRLAFGEPRVR
jgi:catechol 2,3-dioxygenase-like lactoylglutathione lyase family enzyme